MMTVEEIRQERGVWLLDSAFYRWSEALIAEVPKDVTFRHVASVLTEGDYTVPNECVLCVEREPGLLEGFLLESWVIDQVVVDEQNRSVHIRWSDSTPETKWLSYIDEVSTSCEVPSSNGLILLPIDGVQITGIRGEVAVKTFGSLILNPSSPIVAHAIEVVAGISRLENEDPYRRVRRLLRALREAISLQQNCFESVSSRQDKDEVQREIEMSMWSQSEIRDFSRAAEITYWGVCDPTKRIIEEDSVGVVLPPGMNLSKVNVQRFFSQV
jgi:hypothetical protein